MKTQKQFIAAALDLNKVFSLEPAIDPAVPLAELKSQLMLAAGLIERGDKGKFALNTVQVLAELKAPNVEFLCDAATGVRRRKSAQRSVTVIDDGRSIVVID